MSKKPEVDWKKIVDESEGVRVWIPEQFQDDIKTFLLKRDELQNILNDVAERDIRNKNLINDVMLRVRDFFAKNGHADIWVKDVGCDENALKDGKFILNIQNPQG